jgi:hypothetical protein
MTMKVLKRRLHANTHVLHTNTRRLHGNSKQNVRTNLTQLSNKEGSLIQLKEFNTVSPFCVEIQSYSLYVFGQ